LKQSLKQWAIKHEQIQNPSTNIKINLKITPELYMIMLGLSNFVIKNGGIDNNSEIVTKNLTTLKDMYYKEYGT